MAALPIIAAIASLGLQGYGLYEKNKSEKEQRSYANKVKRAQERQAKREAMLRILGVNLPVRGVTMPTTPNIGPYEIRSTLADIGASLANKVAAGGWKNNA